MTRSSLGACHKDRLSVVFRAMEGSWETVKALRGGSSCYLGEVGALAPPQDTTRRVMVVQTSTFPSLPHRNSAKGSPGSARPRGMGTASTGPWAIPTWSPCWGRAGRSSSEWM